MAGTQKEESRLKTFTKSNYFKVKDSGAFKKFVQSLGGTLHAKEENGEILYRFHINEPVCDVDERALAACLEPGWVAVIEHVAYEGARCVVGYATAVNSSGIFTTMSLDDIYEEARKLGKHVADASC